MIMNKLRLFILPFMLCFALNSIAQDIERVAAEKFYHLYQETAKPLLIDVRIKSAYEKGFIPGAHSAPDSASLIQVLKDHPYYNKVFMYCSHASRTKEAARILRGYKTMEVIILDNTLARWKSMGYPYKDKRNFWQRLFGL